jgi:hypothetical protein
LHALITRWPQLAVYLGASWDEHRRRVERHCAVCERGGLRVELLPADVPGFEAFLADRGVTSPKKDDLLARPDVRSVTTAMPPWPPARTAACWCGSGRKYKQCCRRHGLGDWTEVLRRGRPGPRAVAGRNGRPGGGRRRARGRHQYSLIDAGIGLRCQDR